MSPLEFGRSLGLIYNQSRILSESPLLTSLSKVNLSKIGWALAWKAGRFLFLLTWLENLPAAARRHTGGNSSGPLAPDRFVGGRQRLQIARIFSLERNALWLDCDQT